ncbi:MAG: ethylbenzene dehydrogenase-related protein [Actinomycetota bacterium]
MSRTRTAGLFAALLVLALGLRVTEAQPATAQTAVVGAWRLSADPGLDGSSETWQSIPPVWVSTTPQNVTPPMGGGEVGRVAVRAAHWDGQLFVMLEWADSTADVSTARVEDFSDAAAVQFPAEGGSVVPALCMGQADQAVNIWHWRADLQEGIPDDHGDYVDLYPSDDEAYLAAGAVGNPMASSSGAVQNLLAGGFSTLTAAEGQAVTGQGVHQGSSWMVVFSRDMDSTGPLQPAFVDQTPIDTAIAVWNGALEHRNGIKSVSSFVQVRPTDQAPPGQTQESTPWRVMVVPAAGGLLLVGVVFFALRERKPGISP